MFNLCILVDDIFTFTKLMLVNMRIIMRISPVNICRRTHSSLDGIDPYEILDIEQGFRPLYTPGYRASVDWVLVEAPDARYWTTYFCLNSAYYVSMDSRCEFSELVPSTMNFTFTMWLLTHPQTVAIYLTTYICLIKWFV